ncbi:3-oxoadipate enol-lactonase [Marmoricola endophyticus]|uniref:3-oxoadipate enol-lactonase n=1 Tax=Marmoricola endophyticus TaxID=2040280 RepID=A0A917BLC8_9ACTN|nr:4-carboxymuconolactone decarboxylase [Marmoricola endophyticus]GGF50142.1 3-oxoadipate enol-lactonase [Marmoricola endophyticus]
MIPGITGYRMTGAAHREQLPLLVLGPSLGTSATALWTDCAAGVTPYFDVVAWDLPGHGHNTGAAAESFTMAELAAGVLRVVDDVLEQRGEAGGSFAYAGDSVGGAVGLQLLLDHPRRIASALLCCTAARFGEPSSWHERIAQVRASGTAALTASSAERWFAPGSLERHPETGSALLHALQSTDDTGYVQVCEALADFDVRDRLGEIAGPLVAVAGAHDVATPPELLTEIVEGVQDGRLVVLDDVAHLAPAEAPEQVAALVLEAAGIEEPSSPATSERYDAGLAVRREVLGDAHVDASLERITDLTRDFQTMITEYAWGSVWTRPGLDRRSRSMITLTALVARGHHEELAMHLRAALRNGLTVEEIGEVLLQSAIYCGVPDANTAFRIAQEVLAEEA